MCINMYMYVCMYVNDIYAYKRDVTYFTCVSAEK